MRAPARLSVLLLLAACGGDPPRDGPVVCGPAPGALHIVPYDGLVVRDRAVSLEPGVYHLVDADGDGLVRLEGAGAAIDLRGVTIVGHAAGPAPAPDTFTGYGIVVRDAPSARVTGGVLRGLKVAVSVADSPNAIVEDVDVSANFRQRLRSTLAAEDVRDWLRPHDNDANEWEERYGAGISVRDSPGATVRRCRARDGQNGLLLTRSDGSRAYDNDFSFLSGWGIALYRTSDAVVCRNALDWCVRGYSHGVYDRGQDSAGILVFEQCSRNVIALNSATHGGDGLFLYAGQDTLERDGQGGSNDNVVALNDFSHAVANAIEATFSTGNRFVGNRLDDARHGVWAGYSSHTTIADNRIRGCDHGVSIEHGQHNALEGNEISGCGTGVHLWWDEDADLAATAFGRTRDLASTRNRIGPWNTFRDNGTDVLLRADAGSRVVDNTFAGPSPHVRLEGLVAGLLFEHNRTLARVRVSALHDGRVRWVALADPLGDPAVTGPGKVSVETLGPDGVLHHGHAPDAPVPEIDRASLPGRATPALPDGAARGRRFILVDEWGPVDPGSTRLFPARADGGREVRLDVLGAGGTFRVTDLTDGFVAEPSEGTLPGTVTVRALATGALAEFAIAVETPTGVHRAAGALLAADWDVRFFDWTADPREDAAAWTALLAGTPSRRVVTGELDFSWRSGAPHPGVGADRFGTLAETTVTLPAGRFRLETTSDDGIRVWVDDTLVIDDWTHHAPTVHTAVLDLAAGPHHVRVEHFELDGWAALALRLRRE